MINRRRGYCRFLTVGVASLVTVAGCSSNNSLTEKSQVVREISVKTVAVTATEVERTTLQPATVHAYFRAEIRARASGFVKEVKVDIGDYVKAGAELAVIDVPEMQKQREVMEARVRRLEAEEKRSRSGIDLADAQVRASQAKFAEAKFELGRAEASLAAAEAEFDRTSDLVERQSLEARMLDEVRKKRDSELAGKEAVSSAIDSAEAEVAVAEAQHGAAEADLEAARAETDVMRHQLQELEVLMAFATVKAPFAGVVTHRNAEPGELVHQSNGAGNDGPLFVVSQVDKVRIRIPVPETDAPKVNHGDEVTLTFPSFAAEAPIIGNVTRFAGSLDPSTRTMMVEAEMPNPDGKLLPGMFGQASINLATKVAANTLPSRAIRFGESGQAYVYVVDEEDTVSVVQVTTGIDTGSSIEILSGVEPGRRVIDAHLKRFSDGQKVVVLPN